MRVPGLIVAAYSLIAADMPPPPAALAPYIHDGHFDPGDYGWMRGRFDDSTTSEKAAIVAIRAWLDQCFAAGKARTRAELIAMGIRDPDLAELDFRDLLCAEVASMPNGVSTRSFAAFQSEAAEAGQVAETYLLATRIAEGVAGPRGPSLADSLLARPVGEQMLRIGLSWGEGELKDAPRLSPDGKAVLLSRLGAAMAAHDRANTQWLTAIVEKEGWPTQSKVGKPAADQAWLLAQHADADPPFQLKVLRLMEPLSKSGEVSTQNYAYLYDRVMLKLTGRQRYATQAACRAGKRVPLPLEDESKVERDRTEMRIGPLAEYMAMLDKLYGPCPPDPPGAAPAKP